MDGVFAYMSKPSKSGKRKYVYQNYNTHEYSFDHLPDIEYEESKLVYSTTESLKRWEELFEKLTYVKSWWKKI